MSRSWLPAGLVLVGLGLAGLIVAWGGFISIAASSGHWAPTSWFLHWSMRNAVRTQSLGIEPPPFDAAMVLRGAGHFDTGCRPCHGAPGIDQSPVVLSMTPPPPRLSPRVGEWETRELFWIVRHGIKYTGMPAWPAQGREDEVWSVVAFLEQLPGMSPARYRELARPPATAADDGTEAALESCARCHGTDGNRLGEGAFPRLAGQNEAYLAASLKAFANGGRKSGIMQTAVAGLDGATLDALAAHYAGQSATRDGPADTDATLVEAGERIATVGLPTQGVPACASCHGGGDARYPVYPDLAGLDAGYLSGQLRLWQARARGGTPFAHIMRTIAGRLEDSQIEAVAAWYASRPAGAANGSP